MTSEPTWTPPSRKWSAPGTASTCLAACSGENLPTSGPNAHFSTVLMVVAGAVGAVVVAVEPDDDLDPVAAAPVHVVAVTDPGLLQGDVEADFLVGFLDPHPAVGVLPGEQFADQGGGLDLDESPGARSRRRGRTIPSEYSFGACQMNPAPGTGADSMYVTSLPTTIDLTGI